MRHSAWTLWLVPLAVPLLLLLVPGSREPLNSGSATTEQVIETSIDPTFVDETPVEISFGSSPLDLTTSQTFQDLLKD